MNCKHKNMTKIEHKNEIKAHTTQTRHTYSYIKYILYMCMIIKSDMVWYGVSYQYQLLKYIFFFREFSLSVSFLCCTKYPIIY